MTIYGYARTSTVEQVGARRPNRHVEGGGLHGPIHLPGTNQQRQDGGASGVRKSAIGAEGR